MAYQIGSGSKAAAGLQGGSSITYSLLNMRSESVSVSVSKTSEDTLMESKTTTGVDLDSISVAGGISTYLRPEFVDWLFEAAMGEADDGVYTLSDADAEPRKSEVYIERGTDVKKYADMAISSLNITANAQKIVEAQIEFIGKQEATGTFPTGLTSVSKSYKCTDAYLKYGATSSQTALPVETLSFNINNNLVEGPRTYMSGLYAEDPIKGLRDVTINWTMPRDKGSSSKYDAMRAYLESNDYVRLELQFSNGTEDETVNVVFPNVAITAGNSNVSGPQVIDSSFSGRAVQVGTAEPITVTVSHPTSTL